ncbi:YIP1 family protein [Ruegeria arenilitoris]|uniref:YIP1 family protein n=1 Tax=Ruegeria arenilitoris TaxID=1173585 RepID=UPI00147A05C8|nr:YIP1 family protein [Ruegeria arenilitoris]
MSATSLTNLAVLTVSNPAQAARLLLAMRPGREVLWLGFSLAVVLSCVLQVGMAQLLPIPPDQPVPATEPVLLILARSAGAIMLSILAFLMFGRLLGGTGTFDEVFLLTVWLQYLQIAGLVLSLVSLLVMPLLIIVITLATAVLSLYVTLHFLNEAHKFGSLWKSFGVILLSALVAVPFVLALTPSGPV